MTHPRRKVQTFVAIVLFPWVLPGLSGCTTAGSMRTADEPATALVVNRNPADMRVSVGTDGARRVVGLVPTGASRGFTIDAEFLGAAGGVVLTADPVGSRKTFSTGRLTVRPGDTVEWTIEVVPEQSTVLMR